MIFLLNILGTQISSPLELGSQKINRIYADENILQIIEFMLKFQDLLKSCSDVKLVFGQFVYFERGCITSGKVLRMSVTHLCHDYQHNFQCLLYSRHFLTAGRREGGRRPWGHTFCHRNNFEHTQYFANVVFE